MSDRKDAGCVGDGPRRRSLKLESLEARLLLSGNVTAEVIGGSLVVTGDGADNMINIEQTGLGAGEFRIDRDGSGTTINGTLADVIVGGVTKDVKINMGDGHDMVHVRDSDVARDVVYKGGDGDDFFDIYDSEVGRHLKINSNDGNDTAIVDESDAFGDILINNGDGGSTT